MNLWMVTAALVLMPVSVSLAADPPGSKAAGRPSVPVVQAIRPIGTLTIAGIQGDGPGGKVEALTVSGICEPTAPPPTGKRRHQPFVVTKPVDQASPVLMKAAVSRQEIPTVVIEQAGSKVELRGVLIGMIKAGPAATRPTESLELNFESCAKK